jgi:membrane-associated protease RseP (regulator of RpoE activity)
MIQAARSALMTVTLLFAIAPVALAQPQPPWGWGPPATTQADGPALGVLVDDIPFDRLDSMGLSYGVEVAQVVSGSPAAEAGLQAGDILLQANGQPVFSVSRLQWLVSQATPGTPLEVAYSRDGKPLTATITPRQMSAAPAAPEPPAPTAPPQQWNQDSPGYLGARLQPLTSGLREAFEVPADVGTLVVEVYENSPAQRADLRAGDVLIRMDRKTIHDIADVRRVLDYFGAGEAVQVEIIRDRKPLTLTVELGEQRGYGGRMREQPAGPYQHGRVPFFADPDWWRDVEPFIDDWRRYWEGTLDENRGGAL